MAELIIKEEGFERVGVVVAEDAAHGVGDRGVFGPIVVKIVRRAGWFGFRLRDGWRIGGGAVLKDEKAGKSEASRAKHAGEPEQNGAEFNLHSIIIA